MHKNYARKSQGSIYNINLPELQTKRLLVKSLWRLSSVAVVSPEVQHTNTRGSTATENTGTCSVSYNTGEHLGACHNTRRVKQHLHVNIM